MSPARRHLHELLADLDQLEADILRISSSSTEAQLLARLAHRRLLKAKARLAQALEASSPGKQSLRILRP